MQAASTAKGISWNEVLCILWERPGFMSQDKGTFSPPLISLKSVIQLILNLSDEICTLYILRCVLISRGTVSAHSGKTSENKSWIIILFLLPSHRHSLPPTPRHIGFPVIYLTNFFFFSLIYPHLTFLLHTSIYIYLFIWTYINSKVYWLLSKQLTGHLQKNPTS